MTEGDGLPADPADLHLLIHALVDGELDAAATLALERRMAEDPVLAAEHARIAALQMAVHRLPRPEVSEALQARVAAIGAPHEAAVRPARFRAYDWRAMAASILVTAVLAGGATYWAAMRTAPDNFEQALASGHRRSLLAASPVDVASSDRHTVKPWLDARVGLSPPAVDLSKDGFSLIGGRVEVVGEPLPALVYRHREHLITLVAAPQATDAEPVSVATDLSAGGFFLVHWTDGAFSYWAISDIERPDLQGFVARFRAATAGS